MATRRRPTPKSSSQHKAQQASLFDFWKTKSTQPSGNGQPSVVSRKRSNAILSHNNNAKKLLDESTQNQENVKENQVNQRSTKFFTSSSVKKDETETSTTRTESTQKEKSKDELSSGDEPEDFSSDSDASDVKKEESRISKFSNNTKESPQPQYHLSEYERLRLRNIERNEARLKALGLYKQEESTLVRRPKPSSKRKRPKVSNDTREGRTRRSTRLSKPSFPNLDTSSSSLSDTHTAPPPNEEEYREEQYEVSPLVQYSMEINATTKQEESSHENSLPPVVHSSCNYGDMTSLVPRAHRLAPPKGLSAIYTLQFYNKNNHNSWLVGAGKAGIVALWDCRARDEEASKDGSISLTDPTLSWKAHGGRWISDARFVGGENVPSRLVTAANDGAVCLWDLRSVSVPSGAPKRLASSGKELHASGIFAMDVSSNGSSSESQWIATGSKDKTVAVTALDSLGNNNTTLWRYHHSAKVAAVRFRPNEHHTLASASDDGLVCIHDVRASGALEPMLTLEQAHSKPHSTVWDPVNAHILMTAGLDDVIYTWDIRRAHQPLCRLVGHVPTTTQRCKRIHHPVFFSPPNSRALILTGGQGSHSISMFAHWKYTENATAEQETRRCAVHSRGRLPEDCDDVGTIAVGEDTVAASVDGGEVLLLQPSY